MGKYNDVPPIITRAAKHGFGEIRKFAKQNYNHLIISKDSNFVIELKGIGDNSKYFFQVGKPFKQSNKMLFQAYYAPTNVSNLGSYTYKGELKTILDVLKRWNDLIIELDTITVHPEDDIDSQYREEFDDWFDIVDEDAETHAFDATRQVLIGRLIEKSIPLLLEEGFSEDDEPIKKANWIKENVAILTKKQVFKVAREIYAPLRKKGMSLIIKLYKVVETETIAMGYRLGVENLAESFLKLLE